MKGRGTGWGGAGEGWGDGGGGVIYNIKLAQKKSTRKNTYQKVLIFIVSSKEPPYVCFY